MGCTARAGWKPSAVLGAAPDRNALASERDEPSVSTASRVDGLARTRGVDELALGRLSRRSQDYGFGLAAAHRQDQHLRVRQEAGISRLADRVWLGHVRGGAGEVAAAGGRVAEGEQVRQHLTEGAGVARNLDLTRVAGRRRERAPAKAFVGGHVAPQNAFVPRSVALSVATQT